MNPFIKRSLHSVTWYDVILQRRRQIDEFTHLAVFVIIATPQSVICKQITVQCNLDLALNVLKMPVSML